MNAALMLVLWRMGVAFATPTSQIDSNVASSQDISRAVQVSSRLSIMVDASDNLDKTVTIS